MAEEMTLLVTARAYPYLVAQRGALDDMSGDPATWVKKYGEVLASEFSSMLPYLPPAVDSILDVGSGMGGIDALLNEFYGGDCAVTLLDGIADPPEVSQHTSTFNHMEIAREFLAANGVAKVTTIDANDTYSFAPRLYDLIISVKAWCFHIPVERYLKLVIEACIPGHTTLIVDLRGGRLGRDDPRSYEAMRTLTAHFRHRAMIHYGVKFETHLFEAR
jgi:SAM-dependent methyltransferase